MEKGDTCRACFLDFPVAGESANGTVGCGLQTAHHISNPWTCPSFVGKTLPWDGAWEGEVTAYTENLSLFFQFRVLAQKMCLSFLSPASAADSQLVLTPSYFSFSGCKQSCFLVDGDVNNSRWRLGGGEDSSREIQCGSNTNSEGENGKPVRRGVLP